MNGLLRLAADQHTAPADSSDDEFGDIPFKKGRENREEKAGASASPSDDEGSDSGADDEEYAAPSAFARLIPSQYIVEKILGHEWKNDELLFIVEWKGYPDVEDHTLEPEENLANAKEVVKEYFDKIGGRPVKPTAQKKKRKSTSAARKTETPEPSTSTSAGATKKARRSTSRASTAGASTAAGLPDGIPRSANWEKDVESIDTIMRDPDDPTGPLFVYLNWTDGRKSRVSTEVANKKCPQKVSHHAS
ncbi:hypothetical protein KEM52_004148 [Ascosphaera acerosa]|nr:hypothetical protein KEM52_004148 [Ascosphaera acerosa]